MLKDILDAKFTKKLGKNNINCVKIGQNFQDDMHQRIRTLCGKIAFSLHPITRSTLILIITKPGKLIKLETDRTTGALHKYSLFK